MHGNLTPELCVRRRVMCWRREKRGKDVVLEKDPAIRYYARTVKTLLRSGVALSLVVLVTIVIGSRIVGQDQPAARGQGRGRGEPPPPPEPQAGHPSGKLVIWGDMANFERPGVPNRCIAQSRYKRGARA